MTPDKDDIQQMVIALMTVIKSTEQARRQGPASSLALLQIVAARKEVRPSDIAADLGVHQSTITRQVRTLEIDGLVTVTADPSDGRSCFVTLTDAGWQEIARLREIGLSRFAAFVADWDAEEVRTLSRLLLKLEASKAEIKQREQRPTPTTWRKKL